MTSSAPTSVHTAAAARELRAALRGSVLTAGDLGYDAARQVWNGAVDRRPAILARCLDEADVAAAVRIARDHDLPLSVRSGGHDWPGRSIRDGALVIDLTGFRAVTLNPGGSAGPGPGVGPGGAAASGGPGGGSGGAVAEVQGGATAGDLARATTPHGLAPVVGTVSAVGLAGLTTSGGYGLLNGAHGLVADNLLSARVVLADGSAVTASADEHPDLFWALRGGGANTGVVTALRYRVHSLPTARAGMVLFPLAQAVDVLRGYRDLIADAPDQLTVMTGFFTGPDRTPLLFLLPVWCGEPGGGTRWTDALEALGRPVFSSVAEVPFADVLGQFDGSIVNGRHVAMDTRSLPAMTDEVITVLVGAAGRMSSPLSGMYLHHLHGAASRVAPAATAFAQRQDHWMVEIGAVWLPAGGAAAHHRWVRELATGLTPHALPGSYPAMLAPTDRDRALLAYGANLPRLLDVKRRYDPDNTFTAVPDLTA